MKTRLVAKSWSEAGGDALLVLSFRKQWQLPADAPEAVTSLLHELEESRTSKPPPAEVVPTLGKIPQPYLVLCHADPEAEGAPTALWQSCAAGFRQARQRKLGRTVAPLPEAGAPGGLPRRLAIRALLVGLAGGGYLPTEPNAPSFDLLDARRDPATRKAYRESLHIARALWDTRDLANGAGNQSTPRAVTRAARSMARKHGLTCEVWGSAELKRQRCHALLAVGQGSREPSQMITLRYPGRRKRLRPIVFVGKTITFDTGGISLKQRGRMEWMKYDKCGGMAVLAAMQMVAALKPAHPVIGYLAVAENMPGGEAIRPGDVIRSRAGKTIEVLNTDAEGRLVLADALALASEQKPEAVVDLATLTGAVITALGHHAAGLFGTNPELLSELQAAGERSGERLWPFPLWSAYEESLQGPFADLRNIGQGGAGSITAAAFLKQFVKPEIPWAHLDIAGTAWLESDKPYAAPGATLFGAHLLVEWLLHREHQELEIPA